MTDLLNTGKSALFAFQRALSTTSHNIANVNTEGYSRQRVDFQAVPGERTSVYSTGDGVRISSIERLGDQFATARVSAATSAHAEQEVHYELASRIDNLVATEGLSVAPALNDFFNAVHDANADPSSTATRGVVLESADQLAQRFVSMQEQLDDTQSDVNARTREAVKSADQIAQSIADINRQVIGTSSTQYSQQAHDLRDQRDQLVNELSELMDVDTLIQENGSMSVFIGKGVNLVTDAQAQQLSTTPDDLHPDRLQIQVGNGNYTLGLSAQLQGGVIGGLNDFTDNTLNPAVHQLGRLSLTVADELNRQHSLGVDLDGDAGEALFGSIEPTIYSATGNTSNAVLSGAITDTQALQASEYEIRFDGANYIATRSSDGTTTTGSMPLTIDGIELSLADPAEAPNAGDAFVLSATGRAAGSMESLLGDPDKLALAGQLVTSSDIGNLGDTTISPATIIDSTNTALSTPVNIVFSSDTAYDFVDPVTGAAPVDPVTGEAIDPTGGTYEEGEAITYNGWEVSISGDAKAGDTHSIAPNVSGRGDNSNGLALTDMQTELLVNGTETFNDAYGSLVSSVGSNTNTAATRTVALEALRDNAIDRQQTLQGVSLDEEAIDLTRYQQAYQASAQIISTSETLFQSILGAVQ